MVHVFAVYEFLASEIERLLCDSLKFGIALDDVSEAGLQALADLYGVFALALAEILDEADDLVKNLRPVLLDVAHKLLDFFVVGVEFLGEFGMREEGVADLDVAVVLVLGLLVLAQELGDVLVGLQVLALQLLQPPLRLLHIQLFKAHK